MNPSSSYEAAVAHCHTAQDAGLITSARREQLVTSILHDASAHRAEASHRATLVRKSHNLLVAERSARLAALQPDRFADLRPL